MQFHFQHPLPCHQNPLQTDGGTAEGAQRIRSLFQERLVHLHSYPLQEIQNRCHHLSLNQKSKKKTRVISHHHSCLRSMSLFRGSSSNAYILSEWCNMLSQVGRGCRCNAPPYPSHIVYLRRRQRSTRALAEQPDFPCGCKLLSRIMAGSFAFCSLSCLDRFHMHQPG